MRFPPGVAALLIGISSLAVGAERPGAAAPANWPRFRGPDANPVGTHPGLPIRWSATENIEWAAEVPGVGWSSPVVWGKKVFLTSATSRQPMKGPSLGTDFSNDYIAELRAEGLPPEEITRRLYARDREMPEELVIGLHLYCLDLDTGKTLWEREIYRGRPRGGRHRKNSYASETPVTDGTGIYVYFTHHGLFAFDMEGGPLWSAPLDPRPTVRDFGTGASPALHGERLYVLNDNEEAGFLAAFDKGSGRELWRAARDITERRKTGWATPFVWDNEVRSEIVTVGPGVVISYDLEGRPVWRMGRMAGTPIQSPFAWGGRLFVAAGASGGQYRPLAAIRPGGSGDITPARRRVPERPCRLVRPAGRRDLSSDPGGLRGCDVCALFERHPRAPRPRHRRAALPLQNRRGRRRLHGLALGLQRTCVRPREEGETYVIEAGDEYRLVGVNPLGDWTLASPAIVGDRLLIRTRNRLYSIRDADAEAAAMPGVPPPG